MARDTLAEIAAIKDRRGRSVRSHSFQLLVLRADWDAGYRDEVLDFVAIRLVTILEVFTHNWLAEIIDAGDPYVTAAANLAKSGLKIDFAIAQALVGKKVTFGELIAHTQSINRLENIHQCFTTVLERDLFASISGVHDRWSVERMERPAEPIIEDMVALRATLVDLFKIRHIVVHELPAESPLDREKVDGFVKATCQFVEACDQFFQTLLYGNYPLSQLEMNQEALQKADEAEIELASVLLELDPEESDDDLQNSQRAWIIYRDWQAAYRSGINHPGHGSIAPSIASMEREALTLARIKQLRWYLERDEGDM